jgi:hypothetical protein
VDQIPTESGECEVFKGNLRFQISEWQKRNGGKSLADFAEAVFPGADKSPWIAQLLDTGIPQQPREGADHADELKTLHHFLGIDFGELWRTVPIASLQLDFGALLAALPRNGEGDALRKTIAEQIETWRTMTNGAAGADDQQSVLSFTEMTGHEVGRIIKSLASPNFSWASNPPTFCNKFKQRHPDLWARLVADEPDGEKGALAFVARGLNRVDPEIVYLKLMKQLPQLPEPWPADPHRFVERFKIEHPDLWRRLVAAEKRFGERGAFTCLKHALRDVRDPNQVHRMAVAQLQELPEA